MEGEANRDLLSGDHEYSREISSKNWCTLPGNIYDCMEARVKRPSAGHHSFSKPSSGNGWKEDGHTAEQMDSEWPHVPLALLWSAFRKFTGSWIPFYSFLWVIHIRGSTCCDLCLRRFCILTPFYKKVNSADSVLGLQQNRNKHIKHYWKENTAVRRNLSHTLKVDLQSEELFVIL